MKTGTLTSITFGVSIVSLLLLLIVSFNVEAKTTRKTKGCASYGHSCFGGHGKRSNPDVQPRLKDVDVDTASTIDVARGSSINDVIVNLGINEIPQLRDVMKCQNCDVELSQRTRDDQNDIPLLVRQLLESYRRMYNAELTPNDK